MIKSRLLLTPCPTSRTMCASCQGELPCRPNIPAMPDHQIIIVPKPARLQGHQKRNRFGIRHGTLQGKFPGENLEIIHLARTKKMLPGLMADPPTPLMAAARPGPKVLLCAGPNLWLNLKRRQACVSTRPLPPQAIAHAAMRTSLFLLAACELTANPNQTRRGACCLLKVLPLMAEFCRARRPLPILCSTSPCRWFAQ